MASVRVCAPIFAKACSRCEAAEALFAASMTASGDTNSRVEGGRITRPHMRKTAENGVQAGEDAAPCNPRANI